MNIKFAVERMILVCLLAFVCATQANAGSQQSAEIQHKPEDIATFAKGVEKYAAAQGATHIDFLRLSLKLLLAVLLAKKYLKLCRRSHRTLFLRPSALL